MPGLRGGTSVSCTPLSLTAADAWGLLLVALLMVGFIALMVRANADFDTPFSLPDTYQEDL